MAAPAFVDAASTAVGNGSTYAVALPTYASGDLVFIHVIDVNQAFTTNATAAATGWTSRDSGSFGSTDNAHRAFLLSRVMDGSEGTSVTVTFGGSNATNNAPIGFAESYRHPSGAPVIDGALVTGSRIGSTATTFTTLTVPTSTADEIVVAFIAIQSSNSTIGFTPTAGTERYEDRALVSGGRVAGESHDQPAPTSGSYSVAGSFTATASYRAVALALSGPASTTGIKTVLGLSKASVKTVEGVAIASVKTIEGLA